MTMTGIAWIGAVAMMYFASANGQAFSVASTKTFNGDSPIHVPFDKIISNGGGRFDPANNTFTCTDPGTYYFSLSAGMDAGMGAQYVMERNGIGGIAVRNTDTFSNGQGFASRGCFSYLQDGVTLRMIANLNQDTHIQGDPGTYQTSWSAFKYNDLADSNVAFSVGNSVNTTGSSVPMIYDTEIFNSGADGPAFNMSSGTFVCPWPAIYFFHMSAGAIREREIRLNLTRNSDEIPLASLTRTSRVSQGVDTISRSLLISLSTGDQVHVSNGFGSELYSTGGYQTSFSGFLYSRTIEPAGQAFMVYRSGVWDNALPESPLYYDVVSVNKGQGYDEATSVFTCFLGGSYLVSLSAGAVPGKPVSLSLRLNGEKALMIESGSTNLNGIDTMSRDTILELVNGDVLHVQADGGSALYSDIGMQTSFMAMRIIAGA